MANLFQELTNKFKNSRAMAAIFFIAILAFFIGIWNGAEDAYSSYQGLQTLEQTLGLQAVNWTFTYWVMSITPQVGQIIFGYAYASQKKRLWAVIAFAFFVLDFTADLQDRSNGILFDSIAAGTLIQKSTPLIWSSVLTLGFFTVGSEMFIVLGSGIVLETFDSAIDQLAELYAAVRTSWIKARVKIGAAYDKAHNLTPRPHDNRGHHDR